MWLPDLTSAQLLDERRAGSSAAVLPDVGQFAIVGADTYNAATNKQQLFTGGSDFKTLTNTTAFIWQSRFFEDTVVGLFGLRKDEFEKQVKGRIPTQAPDARNNPGATEGRVNPTDPRWTYDPANNLTTEGTTRTYGVMVPSPQFINQYLPDVTSCKLTQTPLR